METDRSWARNKAKCECVWTNNHDYKTVHSEIKETKKLVNEESESELRLDLNECQKLQTMYMRPLVSNILASIAMKLETLFNNIHILQTNHTGKERNWSDIVTEIDKHKSKYDITPIYKIETDITSRLTSFNKGEQGMKISMVTHSSVMRKDSIKEKYHDRRQEIFIVRDSHGFRVYAGEILQHMKQLFKITGYVKPKAGVLKLSNTAKEEISKLIKMNTYFFFFGETNGF